LFELEFLPVALKEWNALDKSVRLQFACKLEKLLIAPHVPSMRLSGARNCYRVKLRNAGYRLLYHVNDKRVIVTVLGAGRRDKEEAYEKLARRLAELGMP